MPPTPASPSALSMLDHHPDPALMVDAAGRATWVNAAARSLLGAEAGASLPWMPSGDAAPTIHDLTIDGRVWRLRTTPPVDGQRLLTLTPVHDLVEPAARARQLADELDVAQRLGRLGVWERDLQTLDGHWDRHTFRMWGFDEQAGTPNFSVVTQAIVDDDRAALERAFLDSTRRCGTYSHRYRVRHADGSIRRLHSQWVIEPGPDGSPKRALGVMMDDTEAWDLARSHDAALAELAVAVEVGQLAIWRRAVDTSTVRLNPVAQRLLGLAASRDGHSLDDLLSRIHPDDVDVMRTATAQALQTHEPTDFEMRVRPAAGAWRHVHTRLVVDRAEDGSPTDWVGVSLDITARRVEEQRAREMMRRFNLAARTAGIGHWSQERGSRVALWSEQLYAMHGLLPGSPVPHVKDWIARFVHEQDRATVSKSYLDWMHSGRRTHEAQFRLVRTDGVTLHVIAHSHVEGEGDASLVFGIMIDVTERRAAEAALRDAAQRATLIANGVGLGTWEHDLVTDESVWDAQMFRLRGLPPGPRALNVDERLALVHPDDQDEMRQVAQRMLTETGTIENEFRVCWPDGGWRWLASRSTAIFDADGRPVRRIGVNWDITDARTAVAEREERLAAQREVQAKSRFLSRMSHELRTPLNAVLGFTQLMLSDGESGDPTVRQKRLEHIRAAGQHLLSLIDDVLDLSQLEGGEVAIELRPVPLSPLLDELLPLVEPLARSHAVRVRTGALDAVPMANPTRLRQVLLNLLTNAIKYNRDDGEVLVDAGTDQGIVTLRVTDNGRGMTPDQMQHLFEPFNRLGAESLGVEGTGIGLAIVKALVDRMGGTVHVESTVGRGSRFELRLRDGQDAGPALHELASPQAMALAATSRRVGRGGTVLYIEDNAVNTLIVAELIAQRSDLRMLSAETGEAGLEIAVRERPHLVLLDMQLPDIDGFQVFDRLHADPRTARIPCIALSANAMPEDIDRAMRVGFSDYWTKPLDFRTFVASIDALFGPAP